MTDDPRETARRIAASLPPAPLPECEHPERVLLAVECRGGMRQVRRYCTRCWISVEGPLGHERVREELGGDAPPVVQIGQIREARRRFERGG